MKKIITFSFALMASATMFGQTVLWDGENYEISSKGDFWNRCNQEVVDNPSKGESILLINVSTLPLQVMNLINVPQPKVSHAMLLTASVSL